MDIRQRLLSVSLSGLIAGGVLVTYQALGPAAGHGVPAATAATTASPRLDPRLSQDERENIQVYKTVGPAVVSINTRALVEQGMFDLVPRQGAGSGVVIDKQGHILTNWHVVAGAQDMKVFFGDDKHGYPAKLVGKDPGNDIAVIQVEAPANMLVAAKLGDSDALQIGQRAIAIGNPFGRFGRTMTTGIVSSLNRSLQANRQQQLQHLIQTDASINPGNSGGPLVNSLGEVIGINTAIASMTGGSVGVGFAIPINAAKALIPELISHGHIEHAWLGVAGITIGDLDPEVRQAVRLPAEAGIMVAQVSPNGPAANAGLRGGNQQVSVGGEVLVLGGDIIQSVDGRKMNRMEDLASYIQTSKRPGEKVALSILRDGQTQILEIQLKDRPDMQ